MTIGLDIGSTTIKCVVLDDQNTIIYKSYERHLSQITNQTAQVLQTIKESVLDSPQVKLMISGSAGMGMADRCSLPFVQEVYATRVSARTLNPDTDVIIELGGEDAKILFLSHGMEVRMNGSCAGGTGAFIDQMATLLHLSADDMDVEAQKSEKIYTIASRCGVFAKSDIQPLLNQGARKSDISASIFQAVVNQTIAGLAQGRAIKGTVLYLGGPLTFTSYLRQAFDHTLHIQGICPEHSLYYVALGAAYCATTEVHIDHAIEHLMHHTIEDSVVSMPPLFSSSSEYDAFVQRHKAATVPVVSPSTEPTDVYLGIDAGSTTVKTVVIDSSGSIIDTTYQKNNGNPVPMVKAVLQRLYTEHPHLTIRSSAVTGYGEEIIKEAFTIDEGIVETVAHFTAAKHFMPEVEFVIDIGGQDIKCFQIRQQAVDSIYLNEACSSGCGSFLQTFSEALGYPIEDFAQMGLFAKHPVDLGSRCTVFMNSSVKQAQKEGSSVEDISAGLSISVVKNALYKVIRATSPSSLGKHIVVQGGTFHNDAVLRAFEMELGLEVVRPSIAGLMGAYGAALHAKETAPLHSSIITSQALETFSHTVKVTSCSLCTNRCRLTVNYFPAGRTFISGNRCERPVTKKTLDDSLNLYQWKLREIEKLDIGYKDNLPKETIGIPMGLNMYEMIFFWKAFFDALHIPIVITPFSHRKLYILGQATIPSDTACFPAKLLHGHIQTLLDWGISTIFYPCMTYNVDEGISDNHFNCPVVAYYPEVLAANMEQLQQKTCIFPHIGIHRRKDFPRKMQLILEKHVGKVGRAAIQQATEAAYVAHEAYLSRLREKGKEIILQAREKHKPIIVLAGRPYHIDPEVNHGIDRLLGNFSVAVISEDALSHLIEPFSVAVFNQWTYHARLYAVAKAIASEPDMHLIQLVSFGCGLDAITSDETRDILEANKKMYTQIKIDEITNLGAVKIRIRSLLSALEQKQEKNHGTS